MVGKRTEMGRRWGRLGLSYLASGTSLIAGAAAQLITFAILARTLGVDQFAVFVAISAITTVVGPLCGLGAAEAMVRHVARDRSLYPALLGHNLIVGGVTGAILVLAGSLILPFLFTLSPDPTLNAVLIALMLVTNIVMVAAIVLAEQIFLAHARYAEANLVVLGFAVVRTLAAVLSCLVVGIASVAEWAVWQAAAHALVIVACIASLRALGRPKMTLVPGEIRNGLFFSAPIMLRTLRQNIDLLVLSLIATPEVLASYGLARRILDGSYLSIGALNRLLYTGTAAAAANGLAAAMPRVRAMLAAATLIGVSVAVLVWLGAPYLPYLFGHDYVSLVPLTEALCWLLIVLAIGSVATDTLGASGHHLHRALLLGISSIAGAMLVGAAGWMAGLTGVLFAAYAADAVMVAVAWAVLLRLAQEPRPLATGHRVAA